MNKQEFEKLCQIENHRVHKQDKEISWLFWINHDDDLQYGLTLNLLGTDFVREEKWYQIQEIQTSVNFKQWLFLPHQKECIGTLSLEDRVRLPFPRKMLCWNTDEANAYPELVYGYVPTLQHPWVCALDRCKYTKEI